MSDDRRRKTYFGRIKHFGRHEDLELFGTVRELSGTAISEMRGVKSRHSRPKLLAYRISYFFESDSLKINFLSFIKF